MLARVGGANATGKRSNIKTIVVRRDIYQPSRPPLCHLTRHKVVYPSGMWSTLRANE
jgi:hypothetical protein